MRNPAKRYGTAIFLILAALAFLPRLAFAAAPLAWTVNVDGVKRQALVFLPQTTAAGAPSPVVFGFHGHGGKMEGMVKLMAFQADWPQAIVVYMQGLPTPNDEDPKGRLPGWQLQAGQEGDRDLKFFDAVLAKLHQSYQVDDKRIYVAGFSNGARFAYLLWGTRGKEIAAFAIAAGDILPPLQVTLPRSLIEMAGKTDPRVHYDDQMQSVATIRQIDGTGPGQACGPACTAYAAPSGLAVTVLVHPGGHLYPTAASPKVVAFLAAAALP